MKGIWQRFVPEPTIARQMVALYGAQAATLILNLAANVLLARALGPAEKGLVDLFLLLGTLIAELGLLGFGQALLYLLANRGQPLAAVHGTAVAFALVAGALTAGLGWLGLPLWQAWLPGLAPAWILLGFGLAPVAYYRQLALYLFIALSQAPLGYRLNLALAAGNVIGLLVLILTGRASAAAVIVVTALLWLLHAAGAFQTLYRQAPALTPRRDLASEALGYGLVVYAGAAANMLHFKLDQVLLAHWLGPEAVGIYAVSVRWAEMLFLLDNLLSAAAVGKISSLPANEAYRLTGRLVRTQTLISLVAGTGVLAVGAGAIRWLYGPAFWPALWPLALLVPGVLAWSLANPWSHWLLYNQGRRWLPSLIGLAGLGVNLVLMAGFVQGLGWGLTGTAAASLLSYGAVALAMRLAARAVRR